MQNHPVISSVPNLVKAFATPRHTQGARAGQAQLTETVEADVEQNKSSASAFNLKVRVQFRMGFGKEVTLFLRFGVRL